MAIRFFPVEEVLLEGFEGVSALRCIRRETGPDDPKVNTFLLKVPASFPVHPDEWIGKKYDEWTVDVCATKGEPRVTLLGVDSSYIGFSLLPPNPSDEVKFNKEKAVALCKRLAADFFRV